MFIRAESGSASLWSIPASRAPPYTPAALPATATTRTRTSVTSAAPPKPLRSTFDPATTKYSGSSSAPMWFAPSITCMRRSSKPPRGMTAPNAKAPKM